MIIIKALTQLKTLFTSTLPPKIAEGSGTEKKVKTEIDTYFRAYRLRYDFSGVSFYLSRSDKS